MGSILVALYFGKLPNLKPKMSYSLNSSKGVIWGIVYGTTIGVIQGDTRSLDYAQIVVSISFPFSLYNPTPMSPFQARCASFWGPCEKVSRAKAFKHGQVLEIPKSHGG